MKEKLVAEAKALEEKILEKIAKSQPGGAIKIIDNGACCSLVLLNKESLSHRTIVKFSSRTTAYCCGMVEFGNFYINEESCEVLELMLRRKILFRQASTGCFIATVNSDRAPQLYKRALEKIGFTPIGIYRNRNTSNILESYIYIPESNAVTPQAIVVKSDLVVS